MRWWHFPFWIPVFKLCWKNFLQAQFCSNVFLSKLEFMQSAVVFNNSKVSSVWRSACKHGSALGFLDFTKWEDCTVGMISGMVSVLSGASRGPWLAAAQWQKEWKVMPHCILLQDQCDPLRCLLNIYDRCLGCINMNQSWGLLSGNPQFCWRENA